MPIYSIPRTKDKVSLEPDASLKQALDLMLEREINHVAICQADGRFVGLVSTNAILQALIPASATAQGGLSNLRFTGDAIRLLTGHLQALETLKVSQFINNKVSVMRINDPVLEAAKLLADSSIPLPIVDDDGKFQGVLSRRNLLSYLLSHDKDL